MPATAVITLGTPTISTSYSAHLNEIEKGGPASGSEISLDGTRASGAAGYPTVTAVAKIESDVAVGEDSTIESVMGETDGPTALTSILCTPGSVLNNSGEQHAQQLLAHPMHFQWPQADGGTLLADGTPVLAPATHSFWAEEDVFRWMEKSTITPLRHALAARVAETGESVPVITDRTWQGPSEPAKEQPTPALCMVEMMSANIWNPDGYPNM